MIKGVLFLLYFCITFYSFSQKEYVTVGYAFTTNLVTENYEGCANLVDEAYKSKITAKVLKQIWDAMLLKFGDCKNHYINCADTTKTKQVFVTLEFKKEKLDIRIILSDADGVIGLFFVPTKADCGTELYYSNPFYDNPKKYKKEQFKFLSDTVNLYGTLFTPKTNKKAICFIVHGSGPHDRYGTIGANKPYRDLAVGLATVGIECYIYDKKSFTYRIPDESITVEKEVVNDALAMIQYIKNKDANKDVPLYIIGHSLGGMLAPKIAELANNSVSGVVFLAANARPLDVLVKEQVNYLLKLKGSDISEQDKMQIKMLEMQINYLHDSLTFLSPKEKLPLNLPASYWLSLNKYNQINTAKNLTIPLLFLQGKRDYQVTKADLKTWKQALGKNKMARYKQFPKLNHLFMEGKGKPNPDEYFNSSKNIPFYVIKYIEKWIAEQKL